MSHAKAKLTPSGRLLVVRRVLEEGWPPAHAAAMSASRPDGHKWLHRFRDEGLGGSTGSSPVARRCPHRTSPEVEAAIIELRRARRRGPHRIAQKLDLAPSTVHAVLARHGLSRLASLDRTTGTPIRYERARPGRALHVDVKKLGRVPEGGGWRVHGREVGRAGSHATQSTGFDYLHVAVDDHSRFAYVEVHANETGETCAGSSSAPGRASPTSAFNRAGDDRQRPELRAPRSSPGPWARSVTCEPGPTGPRPTARQSDSTGPSSRSGPTTGPTPPTPSASTHSRRSSSTTTT